MNATQRGRRADALFYDKVSRLDLCNKVALLESEVEDLRDEIYGLHCTIASLEAEVGDSDATVARQGVVVTKVYLVETSDELIEGWFPVRAFAHRDAAESCAEERRGERDGVRCFARVTEFEVVDE